MEVLDKPKSAVAAYQPFYAQLAKLEADNTALVFDYASKKGNKEARSHINTLRLTKGALERVRTTEKAESLRIGRAVDAEAKEIERRIDAMITVHQAEIDKIEQREKARIAAHQEKLAALSFVHVGKSAADYRFHIKTLESTVIDDKWEEFTAEAAKAKDASLAEHRRLLEARELADAEAAELARLRAEAAARQQKERDEAIAREAADRAAAQAEQKAKAAAELAERQRLDAIEDEKARAAAVVKAEADALAKREANKAHRGRINRAALAAFIEGGIAEDVAKACIQLIAEGSIPAVQINY